MVAAQSQSLRKYVTRVNGAQAEVAGNRQELGGEPYDDNRPDKALMNSLVSSSRVDHKNRRCRTFLVRWIPG